MVTPSPGFTSNQIYLMTEIIEAEVSQVPFFAGTPKATKKSTIYVKTTDDVFGHQDSTVMKQAIHVPSIGRADWVNSR